MRKILPIALLLLGVAGPASGAGGCSPSACIPHTGKWSAPSPQKLTSSMFGAMPLQMTVGYRRKGKLVKSTYGNSVEYLGVTLRYFCKSENTEYVETGFSLVKPLAIPRDGHVKVTVPENYANREHRLILNFKRDTFSGRLSGSATSFDGEVCSTSVSFSGKLKR